VTLDRQDGDLLYRASLWVSSHGYLRGYFKRGEEFYVHRFIMQAKKGETIDHINGDKLDNRRCNLRICTQRENTRNSRARSDNSSGVPGVFWSPERNKWVAQITDDGKRIHLGRFENKEAAIEAKLLAERNLYGQFSRQFGVMKK